MNPRRRRKKNGPTEPQFVFRLYIVGEAKHSVMAVANLKAICRKHLDENCRIDIIDVMEEPRRIITDRILATPTLIKIAPPPVRKIIGDLSEEVRVLAALGVVPGTD